VFRSKLTFTPVWTDCVRRKSFAEEIMNFNNFITKSKNLCFTVLSLVFPVLFCSALPILRRWNQLYVGGSYKTCNVLTMSSQGELSFRIHERSFPTEQLATIFAFLKWFKCVNGDHWSLMDDDQSLRNRLSSDMPSVIHRQCNLESSAWFTHLAAEVRCSRPAPKSKAHVVSRKLDKPSCLIIRDREQIASMGKA